MKDLEAKEGGGEPQMGISETTTSTSFYSHPLSQPATHPPIHKRTHIYNPFAVHACTNPHPPS